MTGFEKYTAEMGSFRESRLFKKCFDALVVYLHCFCHGRSFAMTAPDLCRDLGIRAEDLRALVSHARRIALPIASEGIGYFYATSFEELGPTLEHLTERRDSPTFTIQGLKQAFPDQAQGLLFDLPAGGTGAPAEDLAPAGGGGR